MEICNKKSKNLSISDFMLNNINSQGLSKLKIFDVLNFPRAISMDIADKINDLLKGK